MSEFTRRSFLGKTAVAIGSFAALQKVVGAGHPSDPGPANPALNGQNPDSMWPPGTDSKSLVQNFKYPFSFANKRVYEGGWSREVTVRELPVSKTLAGVNMRLTPGGCRELHWHPNADEWQYFISGKGRMTVVATGNKARTMDFQEGDVGYVEKSLLHYVENTGDTDLVFLEIFKADRFQDLSFSEWLAHTPPELVMAHLHIDRATFDALPKNGAVITPLS